MKIKIAKTIEFIIKFGASLILILLFGIVGKYLIFAKTTNETKDDKEYKEKFVKDYKIYAVPLPKEISFAGEKVPIEYYDVFESLDKEFLVTTYWQSRALLFIKRAHKFFPIIEKILRDNEVPEDFKYLALAESGLTNVTSPAGANGYWQFLEPTAKKYGLRINQYVDERLNIEKSTEAACKYLKDAYNMFGSWTMAAASYNVGMGNLKKITENQGQTSYYDLQLNKETARYVYRILAIKYILENPQKFGFHFRKKDLYSFPKYKVVHIDSSISDLSDFANKMGTNLKLLKDLNPWLISNKLMVADSLGYDIKIPLSRVRDFADNDLEQQQKNNVDTLLRGQSFYDNDTSKIFVKDKNNVESDSVIAN